MEKINWGYPGTDIYGKTNSGAGHASGGRPYRSCQDLRSSGIFQLVFLFEQFSHLNKLRLCLPLNMLLGCHVLQVQ